MTDLTPQALRANAKELDRAFEAWVNTVAEVPLNEETHLQNVRNQLEMSYYPTFRALEATVNAAAEDPSELEHVTDLLLMADPGADIGLHELIPEDGQWTLATANRAVGALWLEIRKTEVELAR